MRSLPQFIGAAGRNILPNSPFLVLSKISWMLSGIWAGGREPSGAVSGCRN
jgi:hypothetical protein